jgi:CHAT domain-containing protein
VLRHAQKLYDWLIRPIAAELSANSVETLVFIPDGALRSIPLAALHDGEEFLAAQFAIATAPGLTLLDPRPMSRVAIRPLLAGLTEPVEGFHPLPGVEAELGAINKMYNSEVLLDEAFIRPHIQEALDEVPYSVVHVASHAQFSSDPQKTFILTYDGKLGLDSLEQLINPTSFRDQPVELITLSACETAAGDDRAALGLAGVAVKAGARSALATLWRVDDAAATRLVAEFYKQLNDRRLSKAEALQRAQLSLLEEGDFEHPYYWAPYLIIGSWM